MVAVAAVGFSSCAASVDFDRVWAASDDLRIFSSPRIVDLNGDSVDDVVIGHGKEALPRAGFVTAHDGTSGEVLWRVETDDDMVGSAALALLSEDDVPDVVIGGRNGQLHAIDGRVGTVLWSFAEKPIEGQERWLNFYTPQFLADVDGDGVPDLLVANGGDSGLPAFYPRPPGHLLVVSGLTGSLIAAAPMPDSAETYVSALSYRRASDGVDMVVFGSGGETQSGSLWVIELASVLAGDLSQASQVVSPLADRGMVAPPSLADLTNDGTDDIVVATFDGRLIALDGESLAILWSTSVSDAETWASPAIGWFDDDPVPDVFAAYSIGRLPEYRESVLMAVSGATGEQLWAQSYDQPIVNSPLAVDLSGDGLDEVIITLSPLFEGDQVVFVVEPGAGRTQEILRREARSFGTGLVGDLDRDGILDYIGSSFDGDGSILERRNLGVAAADPPSWGAYLGTGYGGRFNS